MNKIELLEKLDEITRTLNTVSEELNNLRQSVLTLDESNISPNKVENLPLPDVSDYHTGYTLNDLYKAFGNKKQAYATRLRTALRNKQIVTLEDFLLLSPGELLELDNIGYKTLLQTRKALRRLGIEW